MTKAELQTVLGYVNVGLAVAQNIGVSVGHFGNVDFLQLAQEVNSLLLNSVAPAPVAATTATTS